MIPVWVYWAIMAVSAVIQVATAAKAKNAKRPSLEDFGEIPGVEDGVEITDVAGMAWIPNANMLWYGNLRTSPIKADGGK